MVVVSRRWFLRAIGIVGGAVALGRRPLRSGHSGSPAQDGSATYGFEEGVNGHALVAGSNGVTAISGAPVYSSAAAKHGALGVKARKHRGATVTYALLNPEVSSGSLYLQTRKRGSTSRCLAFLSGSDVQARILLLAGGRIGIAAATGKPADQTTRAAPLMVWTRVDWQSTWDGASLSVTVRFYPVDAESGADYQEISATFAAAAGPDAVSIGSPAAAWHLYLDTLRLYDSVDLWPEPYAPVSTVTFALPGHPTTSGATVSTQVTGATSVDLAVSASADMSSPTYLGVTALDPDSTAKLVISDQAPDTVYYARVATDTGDFIGDPMRYRTLPSDSPGTAFTRRIAFGSCQAQADHDVMGTRTDYPLQLAWNDQQQWGADDTIHVGDFGYWGDQVLTLDGITPDYPHHIAQYVHQMAALPTMRKTLAFSCTVAQRDDHEISHNNGESYDNPVATQNILAMQKVFASPPLEDLADPPRGRYFSYNYGPQIKVIVVDGMSLDRSVTSLGDDGMSPDATFFGADQLAWIKGLLLGPECLKIIVAGKTPVGDSPSSLQFEDLDKLWAYGFERDGLMDYIAENTTTAGAPINCEWWGGDRHAVGYLSAAVDPPRPVSVVLSSGFSMHSLAQAPGESYEYVYGFSPTGTGQVVQWMQITLEDDGAGTITRTLQPRVTDCTDRSAPLGHGWAIGDGAGGPFVDQWSYT